MKNTLLLSAFLISHFSFLISDCAAQAPQGFSFQSVIRDGSGDLVTGSPVGMQISLLQGSAIGTAVYVERHTPTTNANGLASITIGSGTVQSGTFATINWGAGPYYIKSETDPTGGTSYTISGTQQLMSVPYALYAGSTASDDWTNSATHIYSANSGNVGVGTTSPTAKLHLNGHMKIQGANMLEFGAGVSGKQQDAGKIGYKVYSDALDVIGAGNTTTTRRLKFWNEGGAEFTGNVGIGTSDPLAKLDIRSADAELMRIGPPTGAGTIDQTHYNGGSGSFIDAIGHWQSFLVSTSGMLSVRCIHGNVAPLTAQLYEGTGTGGTLVETLTNVTPPIIYFNTPVVGGQTYTISFPSGPPSPANTWAYSSGGGYANGTSDLGGDFFLETKITAVPPVVVIKNTGNMGVGTSSPTARLHVEGDLRLANGSQGHGKVLTSDADGNASWTPSAAINPYTWIGATANVVLPCLSASCNLTGTLLASCPTGYVRAGLVDATVQGNITTQDFELNTPISVPTLLGVDYNITSSLAPSLVTVRILCVSGVPGL